MNIYFRIINFAISKMNITGDKRDIEDNLMQPVVFTHAGTFDVNFGVLILFE